MVQMKMMIGVERPSAEMVQMMMIVWTSGSDPKNRHRSV